MAYALSLSQSAVLAALFWLTGFCSAQQAADPEQARALAGIAILPSKTDAEIKTFDFPHHVFVDRDIVVRQAKEKPTARNELLLWMTGTGGRSRGAREFCNLAVSQGYHVINLTYPTDIPATICKRDADARSFEDFRLSIIQGGNHKHITVTRADSIENRVIKLLQILSKSRAREQWSQFLNDDGSLKWEKMVLAGQSQGGGHAFLMAMKHKVARVIATGAPKDWAPKIPGPAPWLLAESATPKDRFFTFNHEQDHQGATPDEQWAILRAFGLEAFGPRVRVEESKTPFNNTRILSTNYPGGKLESSPAHTSVIANTSADVFRGVWLYMLTQPLP
ncbi:hypothetical protein WJU23_21670 [Prosthecobacter sp. SYSU 5D2]|uniref:BPSS1187 family protein n=1 Tax=Prosthecobacter sp. SYSU 5D2 TaxID=3134134 RepID=UPI0031FF3855